jgi:hypothetical protein
MAEHLRLTLTHESNRVEPRERWAPGPVTLLGDAIHATSPTGGNGANTALRDADLLRRSLIAARSATTSGRCSPTVPRPCATASTRSPPSSRNRNRPDIVRQDLLNSVDSRMTRSSMAFRTTGLRRQLCRHTRADSRPSRMSGQPRWLRQEVALRAAAGLCQPFFQWTGRTTWSSSSRSGDAAAVASPFVSNDCGSTTRRHRSSRARSNLACLHAVIGVDHRVIHGLPVVDGHPQRVGDQGSVLTAIDGPADHPARVGVQHDRAVNLAFPGAVPGDVNDP